MKLSSPFTFNGAITLVIVFLGLSMLLLVGLGDAIGATFQKKPFVLINTTSISQCSFFPNNNVPNSLKNDTSNKFPGKIFSDNIQQSEKCLYFKVLPTKSCPLLLENTSKMLCKSNDLDIDKLNASNFDENGLLIVDTKYNQSYSYKIKDPINPQKKIKVTLDFQKHIQTQNNDINSPRLKIVRENQDGSIDMLSAKNQEIIWTGSINGFFREPIGKYQSERYVVFQFNTGQHGSNASDQERGFGILFDVSNDSNPNILEYRENGTYSKYDYNQTKQFAGSDFVFHNLNRNGDPVFVNSLTHKENIKIKVITFLTNYDKRVVQTFIDNGTGKEIPYWTLKDLSKLKSHEKVKDKNGFAEAVKQGSGYIIARTDNIDTRLSSFQSLILSSTAKIQ
jgi:hypothetical protein